MVFYTFPPVKSPGNIEELLFYLDPGVDLSQLLIRSLYPSSMILQPSTLQTAAPGIWCLPVWLSFIGAIIFGIPGWSKAACIAPFGSRMVQGLLHRSSAFETVDQGILLDRPRNHFGVSGQVLMWSGGFQCFRVLSLAHCYFHCIWHHWVRSPDVSDCYSFCTGEPVWNLFQLISYFIKFIRNWNDFHEMS